MTPPPGVSSGLSAPNPRFLATRVSWHTSLTREDIEQDSASRSRPLAETLRVYPARVALMPFMNICTANMTSSIPMRRSTAISPRCRSKR